MMFQLTPVIAVLILVVMEEGQRLTSRDIKDGAACLNPCCNGRGSKTECARCCTPAISVLILVVMEEGQRLRVPVTHKDGSVLILVVMEEGQRQGQRWRTIQ